MAVPLENTQPGRQHERSSNCHDNVVAESFFQLQKRERIRRLIYADREEGQHDIFDCIEMFYNPKRRHSYADGLSSILFEGSISTGSNVSRKAGAIQSAQEKLVLLSVKQLPL